MDRGAWQAALHRVTQSLTQPKWLSTHAHTLIPSLLDLPPPAVPLAAAKSFTQIRTFSQLLLCVWLWGSSDPSHFSLRGWNPLRASCCQGPGMVSVDLRHPILGGPILQRKILESILDDYHGKKTDIIQAGFMVICSFSWYSFFLIIFKETKIKKGFPGSLSGKESACNVGDLGLIPGLGRSSGGGKGYPLQCSCLENPMDRGAWQASPWSRRESDTTERLALPFSVQT